MLYAINKFLPSIPAARVEYILYASVLFKVSSLFWRVIRFDNSNLDNYVTQSIIAGSKVSFYLPWLILVERRWLCLWGCDHQLFLFFVSSKPENWILISIQYSYAFCKYSKSRFEPWRRFKKFPLIAGFRIKCVLINCAHLATLIFLSPLGHYQF